MRLYTKDSKNNTRFWEITSDFIPNEEGHVTITISHGILGSDKIQTKTRIAKPKNIGKANETTGASQALKDMESLITAQKDKGYVENIDDYKEPFRPMLAHKYADKKHTVKWGEVYGSAKLDGIRCFIVISDGISFMSRTGKPFKNFKHIEEELSGMSECILDGELFNKDLDFPEISSRVNSDVYEERDKEIQFHIYDCINGIESFPERLDNFKGKFEYIKRVEQVKLNSEEDLMRLFAKHIEDGYEGTMIKSKDPYVFGKRSNTLLKYKEMLSDEFLILDVVESEQDPLKPKVILRATNGESFSTGTIKGDKEDVYQTYLVNKDKVIGKWLTLQYQTLSPYGIPLFPVGIGIREGEVIDGEFVPAV